MINLETQKENEIKTQRKARALGEKSILFVLSRTMPKSPQIELTNFLKIFFDFAYYLGISPFRFVKNANNNINNFKDTSGKQQEIFSVHEWVPQKVICAIMHTLCLLRIVTEARMNMPNRSDIYGQNIEQYFLLTMNLFNVLYKGEFILKLWRSRKGFLLAINYSGLESSLPSAYPRFIRRGPVIGMALILNLAMAVISGLAGKFFVSSGFDRWSSEWWYRRLVASTRFTFFYGQRFSNHAAPEISDITYLDQLLAGVNFIGLISRYLLGYYSDLLIMAMGLTLWSSAYSFAKRFNSEGESVDNDGEWQLAVSEPEFQSQKWVTSLMKPGLNVKYPYDEHRDHQDWETIYQQFKALRMLSHLINKALGNIVSWFIGNAILAYSLNLDAIFVAKDIHKRLSLLFNYFCAFGVLFVSADICKQMESIKLWLAVDRNRRKVPTDQLSMVLHEMTAKDIGIRGGNIFTITYHLVATFIATILTYFVICVQQNTPQV